MTAVEERRPQRVGPYRLRERLGEGGMGVVYLATDPAQRLVAVKVLRHGVPGEATARHRLAREVETMRRVHSPHVAEVLDADVDSDPPYIVTRYVPGQTVEELVARDGPMTGLALLRLARGLAAALTAVHAAGVVHRDLKPANVMIVDGSPVVIDFGIAQAPDSTRLTLTGMFMGTPGYLAPEVIEGSPSGAAADVHSWAATVAFAATGRPPFGSGSFEAIFYRIVNGQPDLASMPTPLLPLVLHALARDPSRRPAAAELAQRAACLDPAALLPGPPPARPAGGGSAGRGYAAASYGAGYGRGGPLPGTVGDLPARPGPARGPGLAAALPAAAPALPLAALPPASCALPGLAAAAGPGAATLPPARPGAARGKPDRTRELGWGSPKDYADLLPPVQYGPSAAAPPGLLQPPTRTAGRPQPPGALAPGSRVPGAPVPGPPGRGAAGSAPAGQALVGQGPEGQAVPGQGLAGQAVPGQAPPGQAPAAQPAARSRPARQPLVLAAVAVAIALSVLLPEAGTAAVLAALLALRTADLTGAWLSRRRTRQGRRTLDGVAAASFLPVAACRSLLRMLTMLPLALVLAAAAAVVTFVAVPDHPLSRVGAYGAGVLVACYFLGPWSAGGRRPLGSFFGAVTGTTSRAVVVYIGMAALAAAAAAAAFSLSPAFWPDPHLVAQLHHAALNHSVRFHPGLSLSRLVTRLPFWPFG